MVLLKRSRKQSHTIKEVTTCLTRRIHRAFFASQKTRFQNTCSLRFHCSGLVADLTTSAKSLSLKASKKHPRLFESRTKSAHIELLASKVVPFPRIQRQYLLWQKHSNYWTENAVEQCFNCNLTILGVYSNILGSCQSHIDSPRIREKAYFPIFIGPNCWNQYNVLLTTLKSINRFYCNR